MTLVVLEIEQRNMVVNAARQELDLTDSEIVRFRFTIETLRLAMWDLIISGNSILNESIKFFLVHKTLEYATEILPVFAPFDLRYYLIDAEERRLMDQLFKFENEMQGASKIPYKDFWNAIYSFRLANYRKHFIANQSNFSPLVFIKMGEVMMTQFKDRTSLKASADAKDIMRIVVGSFHKAQQNIWENMLA